MLKTQLGKTDIFLSQFSIGAATFGNVYGDMEKNIMNEVVSKAIENETQSSKINTKLPARITSNQ